MSKKDTTAYEKEEIVLEEKPKKIQKIIKKTPALKKIVQDKQDFAKQNTGVKIIEK